jgi:hypothetical protein
MQELQIGGTRKTALKIFDFTVVASGLDPDAGDFADRLFEAGCDDATVSLQKGAIIVDFSREARSFGHALVSAIADVERSGATVVHVEPDHLVSLSDIAARAGITRAAASLYASGRRGKHFPSPVVRVTSDSPLWDWVEVCRWLFRQGRLPRDEVLRARIVRGANVRLIAAKNRSSAARPARTTASGRRAS